MRRRKNAFLKRALTALLVASLCAPVSAETGSEAAIKTAFLYNFFKFIDWPAGAGNTTDLQLCIAGEPGLESNVAVLRGKMVGDRALRVLIDPGPAELKQCHIVYFGHQKNAAEQLRVIRGLPIVSVSDQLGFIDRGGTIGFVQVENRLGFEINNEAANKNGLHINAQLLKLAQRVLSGGGK